MMPPLALSDLGLILGESIAGEHVDGDVLAQIDLRDVSEASGVGVLV